MGLICAGPTLVDENAPDSGQVASDEAAAEEVEDNLPGHLRPKGDAAANSKGVLVGELVNLPEMCLETKPLLESCLEPCHLEESQDALAVTPYMQPKNDNILLLACLNSAETLDTTAAQPLLAGGQPEEVQMVAGPATKPLPTTEPPLLTLVTTDPSPDATTKALEAQPSSAGEGLKDGQPTAEPRRPQMPVPAIASLDPEAAYAPPFEEYPPLEPGRTLKIRDSFEAGSMHYVSGSVWARPHSAGQTPGGTGAPERERVLVPPAGDRGLDGSAIPTVADHPVNVPRRANKPSSPRRPPEPGAGASSRTGAGGAETSRDQANKPRTMAEMG